MIRETLITYFNNIRMMDKLKMEIPNNIYNTYGFWNWENFMITKEDDFRFRISLDEIFLGDYEVEITIDGIKVFEDCRWIHDVPEIMKEKAKEIIKKYKAFNKQCRKNKLQQSYKKYLKQQKLKKKQKEIKIFEEEKQILINKFNK